MMDAMNENSARTNMEFREELIGSAASSAATIFQESAPWIAGYFELVLRSETHEQGQETLNEKVRKAFGLLENHNWCTFTLIFEAACKQKNLSDETLHFIRTMHIKNAFALA